MISGGRASQLVALVIGGQAWRGQAECAFRLADGKLNITDPWTLIAPAVDPAAGYRIINEYNPIVYLVDEATYNVYEVNCTVDSWRYQLADGTFETNVTFPDTDSPDTNTQVSYEDLFEGGMMDGVQEPGPYLWIDPYPVDVAVAISDSLFNRTIEVSLTCDQEPVVAAEDSCVQFNLNFTNASPDPDAELLEDTLYRFQEPAVPGFVLPAAGNSSPGDTWLNEGNPIVDIDGTTTEQGCNGDVAEYLGEDGEWYFYFTGQDGMSYNLTHVFYATEQDHVNVAKIQSAWSPNMEAALYNRTIRMMIYCNNIDVREEGYILFTVGDGSSNFDISTDEYVTLTSGAPGSGLMSGSAGWLSTACSLAAALALSVVGTFSETSW